MCCNCPLQWIWNRGLEGVWPVLAEYLLLAYTAGSRLIKHAWQWILVACDVRHGSASACRHVYWIDALFYVGGPDRANSVLMSAGPAVVDVRQPVYTAAAEAVAGALQCNDADCHYCRRQLLSTSWSFPNTGQLLLLLFIADMCSSFYRAAWNADAV